MSLIPVFTPYAVALSSASMTVGGGSGSGVGYIRGVFGSFTGTLISSGVVQLYYDVVADPNYTYFQASDGVVSDRVSLTVGGVTETLESADGGKYRVEGDVFSLETQVGDTLAVSATLL